MTALHVKNFLRLSAKNYPQHYRRLLKCKRKLEWLCINKENAKDNISVYSLAFNYLAVQMSSAEHWFDSPKQKRVWEDERRDWVAKSTYAFYISAGEVDRIRVWWEKERINVDAEIFLSSDGGVWPAVILDIVFSASPAMKIGYCNTITGEISFATGTEIDSGCKLGQFHGVLLACRPTLDGRICQAMPLSFEFEKGRR